MISKIKVSSKPDDNNKQEVMIILGAEAERIGGRGEASEDYGLPCSAGRVARRASSAPYYY